MSRIMGELAFVRRQGGFRTIATGGRNPRLPWYQRAPIHPDHRKAAFWRVCDEAVGAELPQLAGLRIKAGEPDPAVAHEPFDVRVGLDHETRRRSRGALHHDRQPGWLVDLDHLPGKSGPQIALARPPSRRAATSRCGAAWCRTVSGRIDVAEVVLEADAGDDGYDGGHDARRIAPSSIADGSYEMRNARRSRNNPRVRVRRPTMQNAFVACPYSGRGCARSSARP